MTKEQFEQNKKNILDRLDTIKTKLDLAYNGIKFAKTDSELSKILITSYKVFKEEFAIPYLINGDKK